VDSPLSSVIQCWFSEGQASPIAAPIRTGIRIGTRIQNTNLKEQSMTIAIGDIDTNQVTSYELERVMFKCLKDHRGERLQLSTFRGYVVQATSLEFIKANERKFMETFHSLVRMGILLPGIVGELGKGECTLPWFSISTYGQSVLDKDEFVPFDPEGYIESLKAKSRDIDEIVLHYIGESIRAFHGHLLVSSTLTLGCASERLIQLLEESFLSAITDKNKVKKIKKQLQETRSLPKRLKVLLSEISSIKKQIPIQYQYNLEVYLDQFFNFIRINRNEKGHPKKLDLNRNIVFGNLQIFHGYAESLCGLISFFNGSKL